MRQAAIAGIGSTTFTQDANADGTALVYEAILTALVDAGIDSHDVDGVVKYSLDTSISPELLGLNLGADIGLAAELPGGGTASCATLAVAAAAVESGQCEAVVCFRSMTMYDFGDGARRNSQWIFAGRSGLREFARPYGWGRLAHTYGMQSRRHMHEFGTTEEHLGLVVQAARAHAATNPNALLGPITLDEYFNSPYVSAPLRAADCFISPSAGACAVVVTSLERARSLRQRPAVIAAALAGSASRTTPYWEMWPLRNGPITEVSATTLAPRLYERAGVSSQDIDVAEIYDCYSYTMLVQLEDYGFCAKGEAGDFITDVGISVDRGLPVNTHGGHLGEAYIHGFNHIVEAVRQIRGTSHNQVDGAEVALVTGGVPGPTSAAILTKDR